MMHRRAALLALLAMLSGSPAVAAGEQQIVASIRPLALIVRALVGESVAVGTLPGADLAPHDFVLRPSGLHALRAATLFVWMGPALERPLDRVLRQGGGIRALALMPELGLDEASDPHLWLDPRQGAAIARVVSGGLRDSGLQDEPESAGALARFEIAMQDTESRMAAALQGQQAVPFIVMHDGLRVFVARFGLKQVGALPATHDLQPGARSVSRLRRTAIEQGARCLFREQGDSEALARTLSEGTAMRVVELDLLAIQAHDTVGGFGDFLQSVADRVADCLRATPMEPN